MIVTVDKWGNSLGVRIPKAFVDELNLEPKAALEMKQENGTLVLTPVRQPEYRLEELLAGITSENLHHEIGTGDAAGNEAW
jgi:antitoxin MazE